MSCAQYFNCTNIVKLLLKATSFQGVVLKVKEKKYSNKKKLRSFRDVKN